MPTMNPMLTQYQFLRTEVQPALQAMPGFVHGRAAECMLLAIPAQESNFASLYQIGQSGQPLLSLARGLYQFEVTGVRGVLTHPSCAWLLPMLSAGGFAPTNAAEIHRALPASTRLQVWIARANLWWHTAPLPAPTFEQEEAAWQYYLYTWRPGKPHRSRWGKCWQGAVQAMEQLAVPDVLTS